MGKEVTITGFLLRQEDGYAIISDEPGGKLGHFDLPVVGDGVAALLPKVRYDLQGLLLDQGLNAVNGDPVHLQLTAPVSEPTQ